MEDERGNNNEMAYLKDGKIADEITVYQYN